MATVLTPRIYSRNFKWGILPSNKVDTVSMRPILNNPLEEPSSFMQDVSAVSIENNDGKIDSTLPIVNSVKSNRAAYAWNYERNQPHSTNPQYMGIGAVACVIATGSVTFSLDRPLPTLPTAKVHCEGKTYYVDRGSKTYEDIKGIFDGNIHDVPQWIQDNASGDETWIDKSSDSMNRGMYDDPTLVDYTKATVPLYPWVRKIIPISERGYAYDEKPTQQDILTTWVDQDKSNYWARVENWLGYNTTDSVTMWPAVVDVSNDVYSTRISLKNKNVNITASVVKIDDYNYRVDYSIPVRYTYYAASQYYNSIIGIRSYHDLDSYCFMDTITKLQIELVAQEFNTEHVDLSYSLDNDGHLTQETLNKHPLDFTSNELITAGAYWQDASSLWTSTMPEYLLQKFKEGKYVIDCEIPAAWAVRNNVHINSVFGIMLQDGTTISRNGVTCNFEVKNIEKRFKDSSFIYALKLMEV